MTPERARQIFAHVAAERLRWGKQYHADDIGIHNLLDAMVVVAHEGNKADAQLREELTRANRQLAAAKARDAKAAKRGGAADQRTGSAPADPHVSGDPAADGGDEADE